MGGRARRVPGRARRAADVARKRVDVRSRRRRRTSDARRYAPLDGSGEPRSIDCAGKRTSTSSIPRRSRQETMMLNRLLAMNNSLSTQSASPKAPPRTRWVPAFLALVAIVAALFVASCKKGGAGVNPADVDYYTCTMHPSVKKQNPTDKCPICSMDLVPVKKKDASGSASASDVDYYTCTMHPSVKKHSPTDKCPICSMDLTPVKKRGDSAAAAQAEHAGHASQSTSAMPQSNVTTNEGKPGEFSVPVERQQQIGVTYATIEKRSFTHTIRAVGMVAYDKQRHWDYVTRVEGYVKNLSVFSRGELVEKDAPILTIYSPDLLTTQREFVDLLTMRDEARTKGSRAVLESTERLVESAKQRLRLWNITGAQIAELEKNRKPSETLT